MSKRWDMKKEMKGLNVLDYIFYPPSIEAQKKFTDFLIQNPEYREAVEGILDLCIDRKFSRKELEEHLKSLGIKIPNFYYKSELKEEGKNKEIEALKKLLKSKKGNKKEK